MNIGSIIPATLEGTISFNGYSNWGAFGDIQVELDTSSRTVSTMYRFVTNHGSLSTSKQGVDFIADGVVCNASPSKITHTTTMKRVVASTMEDHRISVNCTGSGYVRVPINIGAVNNDAWGIEKESDCYGFLDMYISNNHISNVQIKKRDGGDWTGMYVTMSSLGGFYPMLSPDIVNDTSLIQISSTPFD